VAVVRRVVIFLGGANMTTTTEGNDVREAREIVTAHRQREGAGFVVRRPLPSVKLRMADPFLLIDEMGRSTIGPGRPSARPITRTGVSRP